jgi:hypothetical protein
MTLRHPLAHPDGRFPVVDDPDALPAGHGGIAVEVTGTRKVRRVALAPQVGVDGAPALYGWGRGIIAVPPGDHLVEAQYLQPMDTVPVTVRAGEVVDLTYWGAADRPGTWRTAPGPATASTEPPPADRPWLLVTTLRILAKILAGGAVIVAAEVGMIAAGVPTWAAMLLSTVLGVAGLGWLVVSEVRARERALSGASDRRRVARLRVARLRPSPSPGGDEPCLLGRFAPPPAPPPHWGAVVLDLSFSGVVTLVRGESVVDERPNWDGWEPPPVVRIDGLAVPGGWGRWWYPLRPGDHDVEVVEPGAARLRVEVPSGQVRTVQYQAQITVRKDETDTTVLGRSATGRLET